MIKYDNLTAGHSLCKIEEKGVSPDIMEKTYFIKTYGCQMNKHDAERIDGLLTACGLIKSESITESDLVIYYTCCVRESADERFYGQLSQTKYKKGAKIAVGGCLAQKEQKNLLKKSKQIDLVFGTQNLAELPTLINDLNAQSISNTQMLLDFNSDLPSIRENKYKAWVAINRGCDNHCTYCIVPTVRGPEVSRNLQDIVNEVKTLVSDKVVEITLLGQNVNSYGSDIYGKPSFSDLLERISKIGVKRLRFVTSHPKDLSVSLLEAIAANANICNHIHLPIQAGSTRILKEMGRKYTKEHYLDLVEKIREYIPGASITTDIMVGFPTETEADFADTLDVLGKAQFDQAYTFIYSKRDGTAAAKMNDQVDYSIKLKRFQKLLKFQDSINIEKNRILEGKIVEVLVDGPTKKDPSKFSGRTKTNKLVHFTSTKDLTGQFINAKIIEAKPFFLVGEIVG